MTLLSEVLVKAELHSLKYLYINNNKIGNEGFIALCQTIMKNTIPHLKRFDLSSIYIIIIVIIYFIE